MFQLFTLVHENVVHIVLTNGNTKRKLCQKLSISDVHNISLTSSKHAILSGLSSSSSFNIKIIYYIDEQADKTYLLTAPLVGTACLIPRYTQHVLKPHIDTESEHQGFFLKNPFINKGIDFIYLKSIFRDKNVVDSISNYFRNTEPPCICYKYNKSIIMIMSD